MTAIYKEVDGRHQRAVECLLLPYRQCHPIVHLRWIVGAHSVCASTRGEVRLHELHLGDFAKNTGRWEPVVKCVSDSASVLNLRNRHQLLINLQ